jgi:hypothetical protein
VACRRTPHPHVSPTSSRGCVFQWALLYVGSTNDRFVFNVAKVHRRSRSVLRNGYGGNLGVMNRTYSRPCIHQKCGYRWYLGVCSLKGLIVRVVAGVPTLLWDRW